MIKKFLLWISLVFLMAFALFSGEALLMQRSLAEKTLRLHVVANSDSIEDQKQKLRVRDLVLEEVHSLTSRCNTFTETREKLRDHLAGLESSIADFLCKEGSFYDVSVTLCEESFSTRYYDTFSLPAGNYTSLRVAIGNGEGKNWWCVVFPTLCSASSMEEMDEIAQKGGYDDRELGMIRNEEPVYKLQFKMLELLRKFFR